MTDKSYIVVFPKNQKQFDPMEPGSGFETNGIAILQPTVCRITEVLNGTYELYLEHPANEYDPRSRAIQVENIIKADGQLFRIKKISKKMDSKGEKIITANALHIWYDLADMNISKYIVDRFAPFHFIRVMFEGDPPVISPEYDWLYGLKQYKFNWHTTMESDTSVLGYAVYEGTNPVAAFIGGENAFVSIYSKEIDGKIVTPELHRDNFDFYLDWRKHDAVDNAFYIKHKFDMTEISATYDLQDLCTVMYASDNLGHNLMLKIDPAEIIAANGWLPAHHRNKTVKFQYNTDEDNQHVIDRFEQDARRYFDSVSSVKISFTCNYAELSNTTQYKDYIQAKRCNVGDTGTIECEDLGITITNAKIIKKVKDVLKGETESITFGTKTASLTEPGFMTQTINTTKF